MSCILKNTNECLNKNCNKAIEKVCGSFKAKVKIKSDGCQIFNVPHNAEGLAFLNLCKKYLNSPRYRLSKRGRGKRPSFKDCGYISAPSLRVADSEWFAVYPRYRKTKQEKERMELDYAKSREKWHKRCEAEQAIKVLEEKLITVKDALTIA